MHACVRELAKSGVVCRVISEAHHLFTIIPHERAEVRGPSSEVSRALKRQNTKVSDQTSYTSIFIQLYRGVIPRGRAHGSSAPMRVANARGERES
eukprot:2285233-Prymnesium_polylepis.1